jgi:ABC-type amino acid transport system permease subunit
MRSNLGFFSDEKFRSIFFQTLVVGLFALGLFFVISTTSYNLEKEISQLVGVFFKIQLALI